MAPQEAETVSGGPDSEPQGGKAYGAAGRVPDGGVVFRDCGVHRGDCGAAGALRGGSRRLQGPCGTRVRP